VKILFISSLLLFKHTRYGGTKRLYYIARHLSRYHDLDLLCIDTGIDLSADLLLCPDQLRKFSAKKYDAILLAYPFALTFLHKDLLDGSVVPQRVVYLEDDLYFEKFNSADVFWKQLKCQVKRWVILRYYAKVLRNSRKFVAISRQEESVMKKRFPWLTTSVIKYGIDLSEYPLLPPAEEKNVLGFIGNYRHEPNLHALSLFIEQWLPVLKERIPGVRFVVAGRHVPEKLRTRYHEDHCIQWMENINKVADFYSKISIFVNPVLSGRGLRTKVVEAAAFGRPVISTALGSEGLEDLDISIAENAEQCVNAFQKVTKEWLNIVKENRAVVERLYSIEAVKSSMENILNTIKITA
jgi:glycosyltransferase involved in cell wall biosynthesis